MSPGHAFLWKTHVEHGDPSVDKMMYDSEGECRVLTDFDLSLLQWEPRVLGTDRTGTVPFMAIELLTDEYWKGTIKRYYHHELESFIWVIVFVFLLYQDGKRRSNQYATPWMTSNYNTCRERMVDFYMHSVYEAQAQKDYAALWPLALDLCSSLAILPARKRRRFRANISPSASWIEDSKEMWDTFILTLDGFVMQDIGREFSDHVQLLKNYKPDLRDMTEDVKEDLRRKYSYLLEQYAPSL